MAEGGKEKCPWRWPRQYEDEETGLYYNRFRYYDPQRGDYVSQDPIGLAGGAELYGYVRDPLMWVDPVGLTEKNCGTKGSEAAEGAAPELGSKLEYFLGNATGNAHNVERSQAMLQQLQRVGLQDTAATREYLAQHLGEVLNDASNVARVQANGRIVRESLLMGPRGGLKFETVWEANKLITGNLFGGR